MHCAHWSFARFEPITAEISALKKLSNDGVPPDEPEYVRRWQALYDNDLWPEFRSRGPAFKDIRQHVMGLRTGVAEPDGDRQTAAMSPGAGPSSVAMKSK